MVSKILLDDGDFLNEEVTKALAEAKSSSASIVTTTKTLGEATVKYSDFSAEVVTLDKQLFSQQDSTQTHRLSSRVGQNAEEQGSHQTCSCPIGGQPGGHLHQDFAKDRVHKSA